MDRVTFHTHPDFVKMMLEDPLNMLSSVEVATKANTFHREKTWARGDPHPSIARMSDEELARKFSHNASRVLNHDKIDGVLELITGLEKLSDISGILDCLSRRSV
jgi:hypothetical protein